MDSILQDIRHSVRQFWQSRGLTGAAIAALAIGIGANTAIFSIVNAVLLRSLPFPDANRLVFFMNVSRDGNGRGASPAKFFHWQAQSDVVEDSAAFRSGTLNLSGEGTPEQLRSSQVTRNFFRLFHANTPTGRTFTEEEDLPNGPKVAVLSHGLWTRRFAADPGIAGKSIRLGGEPHTVIGVLAPGFNIEEIIGDTEVWIPFQLDPNTRDQGHYFNAAARLKPGVSLEQAQAKLKLSAEDFKRKYPNSLPDGRSFSVESMQEALVSGIRPTLWFLLGAVGCVLLIACANVANLLLARAVGRSREIAIRSAMGAERGRIMRQLLTESLLLGGAGAVLGCGFGFLGMRLLLSVNTAGLPRVGENGSLVALDWRVLCFTILLSLATSLVFGIVPALQASKPDLIATLKESSGRSGSGLRQNRLRTLLVVTEIALAVVLLVGASLLIRTTIALASVKPGYDSSNVLTMRMSLSDPRFKSSDTVERLVRDGVQRIERIPGVKLASATCCVPLEGGYGLPFRIIGRPSDNPFHGGGSWKTISPGYFSVFRIPILRGREFDQRDAAGATPVVIISEAFAKRYWPNADPLGQQILIGKGIMRELAGEVPRQILGIVGDVRDDALNNEPGPAMYVPQAQVPDALNELNLRISPMAWVIRTERDPRPLSTLIQEELRQASGLPIGNIRTMEEVVSRSTSRERFNMLLMSVFASTALLLAGIGIYGLMAYAVEQRTQEIGIRLALGAQLSEVQNMVVRQGMVFAAAGVGIGIGAALWLVRFIQAFLYGVQPWDPAVFIGVPVTLSLIALLAVWIPARRAARIDPMIALRYE